MQSNVYSSSIIFLVYSSRIATSTKLHLYNTYILPIMLYASECWTVNKADILQVDALDQWCLRRILGFKWSDFVRNEDVHHATQQPPLSCIVKTRHLSLFGHIARMNESTDASRILFEPPSEVWRKPRGRPRNSWVRTVTNDLANSYTGLPEAKEATQDRVYWRMFTKHSTTHS